MGPARLPQLDQEDGTLDNASLQQFHNGMLIGPRRQSGGTPRQSFLCLLLFLALSLAIASLSASPVLPHLLKCLFLPLFLSFLEPQSLPLFPNLSA